MCHEPVVRAAVCWWLPAGSPLHGTPAPDRPRGKTGWSAHQPGVSPVGWFRLTRAIELSHLIRAATGALGRNVRIGATVRRPGKTALGAERQQRNHRRSTHSDTDWNVRRRTPDYTYAGCDRRKRLARLIDHAERCLMAGKHGHVAPTARLSFSTGLASPCTVPYLTDHWQAVGVVLHAVLD
jgi:hypothetical protein